jgi:uncharacterized cupredoxin-like copper-binding protein
MRPRLLLLIVPLALAAAGCGGGSGGGSSSSGGQSASGKTISISETEYKLDPAKVDVAHAGSYTFQVKNDGQYAHALTVEGQGTEARTDTIEPGESETLKVTLKGGSYELYCPIDGHRQRGMEGTLTVGGAASSGSTTPTQTGRSGYGY